MDILKRIDFVQQFAKEYADGAWSIDVDQWKHHVTPEFIEDIRQYIVSLQLKLMHEQTKQENLQEKPFAWCALSIDGKHISYFDGKPMFMVGSIGNAMHDTPLFKKNEPPPSP